MLSVGEIGALPKLLPHSLLSKSWLWSRPAEQVSQEELLAFLGIWKASGRATEARRNIDSLLYETYQAMLSGRLKYAPYASFCEPDPAFTVGDLADLLEPMSVQRRRAAIFALETAMQPGDVVLLDWKSAHKMQDRISGLAEAMVRASPRHIKLNYVFWEFMREGLAAPLFGFHEELQMVTGLAFDNLLSLYRRMVWVDAEAEHIEFLKEIS